MQPSGQSLLRRVAVPSHAPKGGAADAHEPCPIRLELLGTFQLMCDGSAVGLSLPGQRLLAFLALQARPVVREYVAGSLWSDCDHDKAFASLRTALWRVRRPGYELVEVDLNRLRVAATVAVDLVEVDERARRILDRTASLDGGDGTLGGLAYDLLVDWYDEWVLAERERFRQLRVHALESLSEQLRDAGRFAEAIEAALAAVEAEPLRESAQRAVMLVHLAEGNVAQAVRQYETFRTLLRDKLDLEPSSQLAELVSAAP
jgi:DNA-binding SARP family transcriptional activator